MLFEIFNPDSLNWKLMGRWLIDVVGLFFFTKDVLCLQNLIKQTLIPFLSVKSCSRHPHKTDFHSNNHFRWESSPSQVVKLQSSTLGYKHLLRVIDGFVCLSLWLFCVVCDISPQLTVVCEVSSQRPSLGSTVVWTASSGCFLTPGVEWSTFAFSQTLGVLSLMM